MLWIYCIMAEMERDFISKRTKDALASVKARGLSLVELDLIRKLGMMLLRKIHMNELSIPTARGGK